MSKIPTPEDLLSSQVEEFNKGNIDFLMTLYEKMHVLPPRKDKLLTARKVYVELFRISLTWEVS
jgi:hypothetical protein